MQGFDLNSIFQAVALVNNQQAEGAQQVAGLSNAGADIANEVADNTLRAGQLGAEVQRTEQEYLLRTEQQRLAIANAFGTNQGAASDVITQFAEKSRMLALDLQDKEAKVLEMEANNNLLSNPLGWLKDVLIGDDIRGERDIVAGQLESLTKTANTLNQSTQIGIQTQNAIQQTVNQSSIDNLVDATVADATAKSGAARLQAIQYQIQGVKALTDIGADAFQRNIQAYNLGLQAENLADSRAERKIRLAALQKQEAAEMEEDAYYAVITERVRQGAAVTGRSEQNISVEQVKLEYNGPNGAILRELNELGFGIAEQGGAATGVFGDDPVEAASKFIALGGRGQESWKKGALSVIETAYNSANTTLAVAAQQGQKITPEVQKAEVKRQIQAITSDGAGNVKQSAGHYNSLPPLPAVMANKDMILNPAGKLFADTVIADLLITGNENPEAELVLATGIKQVKEGKLTQEQWKEGMHNFYQSALGLKAATGGYNVFQLPMPASYNISASRVVGDKSWGAALYGITPMGLGSELGQRAADSFKGTSTPPRFDLLKKEDYDTIFTLMMSKDRADKILQGAAQ